MTKTTRRLSVAFLACLLMALPVAAKDIARVSVSAGELVFTPEALAAGYQLTVTGPGGYLYAETFDGSGAMAWAAAAADGGLLADGAYTYELRPIAHQVKRGSVADLELGKPELTALSGTVTVRGGSLVNPDQREESLTKDIVHADDVIITGSLCVGFDCFNGENFGFDTIRLKENNLRIKFQDTSNSGSFPSNDWQITANDSASGGANKFSIDDIDGGRTPFTIEAGAPSHSLYVDDGGRIGLGTSTPVVEVHVVDGDSPTLRLQQDGSSGFTPQTWDIAGNETNFFVRDVTNGSKLPFKIFPNAPTNSLTIEGSTGDIGIGTQTPVGVLHIENTSGDDIDDVLVDSDGHVGVGTTSPTSALHVKGGDDNANGQMRVESTGNDARIELQNADGGAATGRASFLMSRSNGFEGLRFMINNVDAMIIDENRRVGIGTTNPAGLLDVNGAIFQRGGELHADFVFEPGYELDSIAEHAEFMWKNKHLPAIPPKKVDDNGAEIVEIGSQRRGILEELEKAHIYIEQLHGQIGGLQERLARLEALLGATSE